MAGWSLATFVLISLVLLLPVVVADMTVGALFDPPSFVAYVIVVWSGARLSGLLVSGKPAIVQLTFWAFVYVFLGLAALTQINAAQFPIPTR